MTEVETVAAQPELPRAEIPDDAVDALLTTLAGRGTGTGLNGRERAREALRNALPHLPIPDELLPIPPVSNLDPAAVEAVERAVDLLKRSNILAPRVPPPVAEVLILAEWLMDRTARADEAQIVEVTTDDDDTT